jgi:molecular chaperone GrpE
LISKKKHKDENPLDEQKVNADPTEKLRNEEEIVESTQSSADVEGNENIENSAQSENNNLDNTSSEELMKIKKMLEESEKKSEQYYDLLQRSMAEFDNYKKRTVKEKENLSNDVKGDVASAFLPVVDNMERAMNAASTVEDSDPLKEGISLVYKQMLSTFKNLGIEEIQSVGGQFDPELHNAVMHVTDETIGENEVVEEFQKGYTLNGKVIRHSMVKVAN